MILPKITVKTRSIEVKKGNIVNGYLKNDSLESSTDGFIHQIFSAYGTEECADFLNNTITIESDEHNNACSPDDLDHDGIPSSFTKD